MSDLISRNDAAVAACDACNRMFGEEPCWDSECLMKRRIDEVKAVDAVPVVHGEWIKCGEDDSDEGDYYCSACNHEKFFPLEEPNYNYCPHCGAKMDGGK